MEAAHVTLPLFVGTTETRYHRRTDVRRSFMRSCGRGLWEAIKKLVSSNSSLLPCPAALPLAYLPIGSGSASVLARFSSLQYHLPISLYWAYWALIFQVYSHDIHTDNLSLHSQESTIERCYVDVDASRVALRLVPPPANFRKPLVCRHRFTKFLSRFSIIYSVFFRHDGAASCSSILASCMAAQECRPQSQRA